MFGIVGASSTLLSLNRSLHFLSLLVILLALAYRWFGQCDANDCCSTEASCNGCIEGIHVVWKEAGDTLILFHLAEVGWQITCLALEELDEVGRVFVAKIVGYLLDHHVGVAHHALGFEDDAVVDECQG